MRESGVQMLEGGGGGGGGGGGANTLVVWGLAWGPQNTSVIWKS